MRHEVEDERRRQHQPAIKGHLGRHDEGACGAQVDDLDWQPSVRPAGSESSCARHSSTWLVPWSTGASSSRTKAVGAHQRSQRVIGGDVKYAQLVRAEEHPYGLRLGRSAGPAPG